MKGILQLKDDYAVSEILGGILLVLIAVTVFSVIYLNVTSKDYGVYNTNVIIEGSVNDQGLIVLEHKGGDVIRSYKVCVSLPDGTFIGSKSYDTDWAIGECRYPLSDITDIKLVDETISLMVTVYTTNEDRSEQEIFKGELHGKTNLIFGGNPPENPTYNPLIPLLISSLNTNTIDEDLICYSLATNVNITPAPGFYDWDINMDWQIDNDDLDLVEQSYGLTGSPGWIREDINNDGVVNYLDTSILTNHYGETQLTYIYNWLVNGNSITNLLMPFNTNNPSVAKDYSGNQKHGTVNGATWNSNGVVGGCYQFDGNNNISLPYCFDSGYIGDITVEAWIKTNSDGVAIDSFDRNNYWALELVNDHIQWSTSAEGETTDISGVSTVNDNNWHYIAATYDSSSGDCTIYVDGELDKSEKCHNPGDVLGSGDTPNGYIGSSDGAFIEGVWNILTYDNFESGFGNYVDGGRDCSLYTYGGYGSNYAHQGNKAIDIQGDGGWDSSFYYSNGIDVNTPGYTSITVDFWFKANDIESGEDFKVKYYNGYSWVEVADYDSGDEFVNGQFYHKIVWINESSYNFPSNMKILFECSASSENDDIYIDQVYVNATTGNTELNNFIGYIDEFRIYNHVLSAEQIYQNYLCMSYDFSDVSVIVSNEIKLNDVWSCIMTPNDSSKDGDSVESNSLEIGLYYGE